MIHHQFCSTKSKTLTRLLTILSLAVCSLAAGTVKADVITITGVTDTVRIKGIDNSVPFDTSQSSSNVNGTLGISQSFAPQGGNGYRSDLTSNYPFVFGPNQTGLFTNYEQWLPASSATAPTSFISGSAEVFFTINTSQSLVTSWTVGLGSGGDPDVAALNRLTTISLFDITNNVVMISGTEGKLNGSLVSTLSPFSGNLVNGNQYRWRSSVQIDNNGGLAVNVRGVGSAGLVITTAAVPEPSSAVILGLAGLGMLMRRRRR